jgi:ABC-type nickel/cobalt efflux system permease component RcnA
MLGIDDSLAQLGAGGSLGLALLVAVLLGLRHATDPDHLTAVSTLVLSGEDRSARRASRLGLAWGIGHATTLLALGLPFVLLHRLLPDAVQRGAEVLIGVVIVALAIRLLVRWRRGYFHAHVHEHGPIRHAHPHVHEGPTAAHAHAHAHGHAHAESLGRTPLVAFGIGLVHGAGGSAGVGILLLSAVPDRTVAAGALVLFAAATAGSMTALSSGWAHLLASGAVARRLVSAVPVLGAVSLGFGVWYAAGGVV